MKYMRKQRKNKRKNYLEMCKESEYIYSSNKEFTSNLVYTNSSQLKLKYFFSLNSKY